MEDLTSKGRGIVDDLARQEHVSSEAVMTLLTALQRGGGRQAQFNHPELGGMGQWSRGGMIMIGDMFNQQLKARVDRLCSELAKMIDDETMFAPAATTPAGSQVDNDGGAGRSAPAQGRWPEALGRPSATGSQNDLHYAVFPDAQRLAIERNGKVTIYDTGDHRIGGASQQQSGDQSLSFTSQRGVVRLSDLPVVEGDKVNARLGPTAEPAEISKPPHEPPTPRSAPAAAEGGDDVIARIEQLAGLHRKGVLTDEEFSGKKADLLGRI